LRSLARAHTQMGLKVLAGIASNENAPAAARVSAVALLFERGWGKATQLHAGEVGENEVRVAIRHITEGSRDVPQVIEAKPLQLAENGKRQP
jgi:hypothetical protein